MAGFFQLPLAGGFNFDAVAVEGAHELLRGVGVQRRRLQQQPQFGRERFEFGWTLTGSRAGSEVFCENLLVEFLPPRDAGVLHFGGDHGSGGFRRKQQLEPLAPAGVRDDDRAGGRSGRRSRLAQGLLLRGVLGAESLKGLAGALAGGRGIKQGPLFRRRGRRLQPPRWLVQLVVLGQLLRRLRVAGVGGELRVGQDRTAQGEVVAALEFHSGAQQRGIPVMRAVPDPARVPLLKLAHNSGEVAGPDHTGFRIGGFGGAIGREVLQCRAVGVGSEQQIHRINSALLREVVRARSPAAVPDLST
ncbi:hypothetical protein NicSoilC12_02430 [Arthrobacter sp. NicSoilC12]|nr:hypothetical protein NicSoilC12_02430 [Arthrobacter sp. NicSoilC12]